MRPIVTTLGSAVSSSWYRIDQHKPYFGIGMGVSLDATGNLTYSVQHSFNDPEAKLPVSISRTTTVSTITFSVAHGLTTSDSVIVAGSGSSNLDGTFNVASVTSSTVITVTVSNTGATSANAVASPMSVFNNATLVSQTASMDGNYAFPIMAIRLTVTSYTAGNVTLRAVPAGL